MSSGLAIDLLRNAVFMSLLVAAPMLIAALAIGVIVSLVQAVTQLQEQTLTFVPKLVGLGLVFAIALPWFLSQLVGYLTGVLNSLPTLVS